MRRSAIGLALILSASLATTVGPATAASPTPDDVTVGLVDPASGEWHLRGADGWTTSFYHGNPGDLPMIGDWDCDGTDTPGLYRQSDGYVYLRNENSQGVADTRFYFGNPGDVPLAGDFNGDGCSTVSVYRPPEGRIFVINELGADDGGLGAAEYDYYFGNPGDQPFVGDFDGDGIDTIGLHRETTGFVYFRNSHTQGNADVSFFFGDPGDRFVAGDWTGNGVDTPGLFRPSDTTFYLRYTNTQGNADATIGLGDVNWVPVAGRFGFEDQPIDTRSWSMHIVDGVGDVGRFNDITMGADGMPVMSYGSALGIAYQELRVAQCGDAACATSDISPVHGSMFESTSIAVASSDNPVISFFEPSSQTLTIAECGDPACEHASFDHISRPDAASKFSEIDATNDATTVVMRDDWWATLAVEPTGSPTWQWTVLAHMGEWSRPSLDLGPSGLSRAAVPGNLTSVAGGYVFPLLLLRCADTICTYGLVENTIVHAEPVTIAEANAYGASALANAHTSVAVNAKDVATLAISWDRSGGPGPGLDVITCRNASCTDRTVTKIDAMANAGDFVDLELTADSLPIMAYTDPAGHVKVALCLDAICAEVITTTIATTGAGTEVSMAIDRLGMPVVAIYDKNNGDLVVARLR